MRASLSPLAVVEARRLLTHPILLMGAALSALAIAFSVPREGQLQSFLLMGLAILPLALGTFVAANQAALRSRRDRAEELLDTLPQDARTRTGAQLLAVLAALPIAFGLLAAAPLGERDNWPTFLRTEIVLIEPRSITEPLRALIMHARDRRHLRLPNIDPPHPLARRQAHFGTAP